MPLEPGESPADATPDERAGVIVIAPADDENFRPEDEMTSGSVAVTEEAPRRARIAFVVVTTRPDGAAVPGWVRTVASEDDNGPAGVETLLALGDGWRDMGAPGAPILFPDRGDPGPFLAARDAGLSAWLAYDRIESATPDLGPRLAAAQERARRDGAVAVILADDPALLAGVSDWLAAEGNGAPEPVPVSALH